MSDRLRILVVGDAREVPDEVHEFLDADSVGPADLHVVQTREEALECLKSRSFDAAFFDHRLVERDGLCLLRHVRTLGATTPVFVLDRRRAGQSGVLDADAATEDRVRALVENSSDALLLIDADGRVMYMAPSASRHLGWTTEQMVGRSVFEFVHPDDLDAAARKLAEVRERRVAPVTTEVRFRHADGSWRILQGIGVNHLTDASVRAIVVTARDITDRRRLEDQLRMSQKLEAIGQLAGGVAHDFNNLLTSILGYSNLLLEEVPADSPLRSDLEEIRSAGERAAALTRQLLAFSRRQMLQPRIIDVNELIWQLEKLLRRLISEDVELVTKLDPDLMLVKMDPASLEQVLVNLAVNARDAMRSGGRLTIETSNIEVGPASGTMRDILPGRYVSISLSDTGHGMDAATRAHVFEPFFTTKEHGRGNGLGLATVYGIVKQSGGYILVQSEPGRGTAFETYLPGLARTVGVDGHRSAGAAPTARGTETVLLVEDEETVRVIAREVLRRHGYDVLEARHGADALTIVERHAHPIDLVITDVVMPHMSGRDLAQRLSAVQPNLKVLYMSGYADHAVVQRDLIPDTAFLQKPFTPEVFARKVRQVLDHPQPDKLN